MVLAAMLLAGPPALAEDAFTPDVDIVLEPGGEARIDKHLHLDAEPDAADIVLALDTTGSMDDALAQATSEAAQIVTDLQADIPAARLAVVEFRDYPGAPGDTENYPYKLVTSLTGDAGDVHVRGRRGRRRRRQGDPAHHRGGRRRDQLHDHHDDRRRA